MNLKEKFFFGFQTFDGFVLDLKLLNNKVFLYSNFLLRQFNPHQLLFNRVKHGIKHYNQTLFFDGFVLLIEANFVYITYDKDPQTTKPVVRRLFVKYRTVWAETFT